MTRPMPMYRIPQMLKVENAPYAQASAAAVSEFLDFITAVPHSPECSCPPIGSGLALFRSVLDLQMDMRAAGEMSALMDPRTLQELVDRIN